MKNIEKTDLTFGKRFKILLVDFTSAFFLFHIFRFLISYFCFIPFLPGFPILWLIYSISLLVFWQQTLGSRFFGIKLVNQDCGNTFRIRIVMRELFTSLSGIFLIVFCFSRYLPSNLGGLSMGTLIKLIISGAIIILIILLLTTLFRANVFKVKIADESLKERKNSLKYTRKQVVIIYSALLLCGGVSRYFHTCLTNDVTMVRSAWEKLPFKPDPNNGIFDLLDWTCYTTPRPTTQSVQEYINYLDTSRENINDYVLSLFDKYDHVILCERLHTEMTQYDMIYNLVTDSRFVERVGNVFTEVGNIDSREAYRKLADIDFPNDSLFQQTLSSFMMENQSFHLLWANTNWFDFLGKMAHFNHKKEKKVEILFTDRANWIYNDRNYNSDSLMANNIITTIEKDSLKKSLTIMNYRHAYLKDKENCGYFISQKYPGKVANLLINTARLDMTPLQSGKWDVAFEQMPENEFAFDLQDSPFGEDRFDHFLFLSPLAKLQYKDMFTGVIYYKPLYLHYIGYGFPYMMQPDNIKTLRERAIKLNEVFNENHYYYRNNAPFMFKGLKLPYFATNLLDNIFFAWNLIWGVGILIYLSIVCVRTKVS